MSDVYTRREAPCYCGKGSNTPTGKPSYCMRHMRWSDESVPLSFEVRCMCGCVRSDFCDGCEAEMRDAPPDLDGIEWAKGYNDWRRKMRDAGTPRFYHNPGLFADFVIDDIGEPCSTWMVPGTYDAEADAPPPPPPTVIATMLGYPFDVDKWCVEMGGQFWSTSDLRMIAQMMDDAKVVYDEKVNAPHKWDDKEIRMSRDGWRH